MLNLLRELRLRTQTFLFLIPFLASFIFNLLVYRQGYRLSPDSVYYVSVANNLADRGSLFGFDSNFLDQYPPVYSILLYPGMFFPLNTWVFLLHVAAGFLLIVLFMQICRLLGMTSQVRILLVLVFSLSVPYLEIYGMVWSETIFNALLLLVVFYVIRILSRTQFIHQDLIWLLVSTWLLLGTRYIGLIVIPVIFFFLMIKFRNWFLITTYSLSLSFPVLGYYVHYSNHDLGVFGTRFSSTATVSEALMMLPRAIGSLFLPNALHFLSVLLGFFVLVFFSLLISKSRLNLNHFFLITLIILYLLALIYSEIRTQVDPINTRLLSPIASVVFILMGSILSHNYFTQSLRILNSVIVSIMSILLVANGTHLFYNFSKPSSSSTGLIHNLNAITKMEPVQIYDTPIFSTNPWRTFVETGLQPVNLFPTTVNYYNPPDKLMKDVSRLENSLSKNKETLFFCYTEILNCESYLRIRKVDWDAQPTGENRNSLSNLFIIRGSPLLQE